MPTSIESNLRQHDEDRYFASLFAPAEKRDALVALYAFNLELARIAETARDPMMAAIRLQWWSEAVDGARAGTPRRHDVVEALATLFAQHDLPAALFQAMIDARQDDAAEHSFATLSDLERYADATNGNLMRLAARILGTDLDDAVKDAGIATALTGILRAIPFHAARGKVYLPVDFLTAAGTSRDEIVQTHSGKKITPAIVAVAQSARAHLATAHLSRKPGKAIAALLPAATAPLYLKRMTASGFDAFKTAVDVPLYRRQLAFLRASWRGRI